MITLKTLLDFLCESTGAHISITDTSGIMNTASLMIPFSYRIHAQHFCDVAKSNTKGFEQCMRCKRVCNDKALRRKRYFDGICSFGLYELVYPVAVNGTVLCIVYVGNLLVDPKVSRSKLLQTAAKTQSDISALLAELNKAKKITATEKYFAAAELVADFILKHLPSIEALEKNYHWAVRIAKDFIKENYAQPLTLKLLANSYFINEKYLGRIFKKQVGVSFHEYLTKVRFNHACSLLYHTDSSILKIALDCGFGSPSYFNNVFFKITGMTPKLYRKEKAKNIGKIFE